MSENQPLLQYKDEGFSYDLSSNCHLRIQIAADQLALAVYDPLPDAFLLVEKYSIQKGYGGLQTHQAIARILNMHRARLFRWKKIEAISMSAIYTLIPDALFEGLSPTQHLNLVHSEEQGVEVKSYSFNSLNMALVYAIKSEIQKTVLQYFPESEFSHYISHLLRSIFSVNNLSVSVVAHVHGFNIDILVIKDNKLIFCNIFQFQSPDDFIYFLLLVYDKLGIDREKTELHLCGEIESGSALYKLCFKYFRTVTFFDRVNKSSIPPSFNNTDPLTKHAFFSLLHP